MGIIFKNQTSQDKINQISQEILASSYTQYNERLISTSFGPTNIVYNNSNPSKKTIIILHGGSGNAAITAWLFDSLASKFNLIIPDIIGGVGKSDEKFLNPQTNEYGKWLEEIIGTFKLNEVNIIAVSQGSYPVFRYLEQESQNINKVILYVPAAFVTPKLFSTIFKFFLPLLLFRLTKVYFFYKILEKNIFTYSPDTTISNYFSTVFRNTKFDMRQPKMLTDPPKKSIKALVISAENDLFFDGEKIKIKAKSYFGEQTQTVLLSNVNHSLTKSDSRFHKLIDQISDFLHE